MMEIGKLLCINNDMKSFTYHKVYIIYVDDGGDFYVLDDQGRHDYPKMQNNLWYNFKAVDDKDIRKIKLDEIEKR